jgi:hypothetical protein
MAEAQTDREVVVLDSDMTVADGVTLPIGTTLSIELPLTKAQAKLGMPDAIPDLPLYCSPNHLATSSASAALGGPLWSRFICLQDAKGGKRLDHLVLRGYKTPDRFASAKYEIIWASQLAQWTARHSKGGSR